MMIYDKKGFEKLIGENKWLNKEYVVISAHIYFGDYEIAKEKIKIIIKENQQENNKEKIVWSYYILKTIEKLKNYRDFNFEETETDLNKEYRKYFKKETSLYQEIFKMDTIAKVEKNMNELLTDVRLNEKSLMIIGFSSLEEAQILCRDMYKYHMLNGITLKNVEFKKIMKEYVEILLGSYKNEGHLIKPLSGKELQLFEFEYLDYHSMIQISSRDLKDLIDKYNIEIFNCKNEIIEILLETLKNILELLINENAFIINPMLQRLENILLLLFKHELNEPQINCLMKNIYESDIFSIFYNNDVIYGNIQDLFIRCLNKNYQKIDDSIIKDIFLKILTNENAVNGSVIEIL